IVNNDNVLRMPLFLKQTKAYSNQSISLERFHLMIKEMFKQALGERIIIFNRIISHDDLIELKKLLREVNYFKDLNISKIIAGDLFINDWSLINE
ncbi:MAG: hypothetical protein ACRCTA_00515, partial [Bacilli bacterium]